jgi:hypothetical protein
MSVLSATFVGIFLKLANCILDATGSSGLKMPHVIINCFIRSFYVEQVILFQSEHIYVHYYSLLY